MCSKWLQNNKIENLLPPYSGIMVVPCWCSLRLAGLRLSVCCFVVFEQYLKKVRIRYL